MEDFTNQLRGHRFIALKGRQLAQGNQHLPAQLKAWFEGKDNAESCTWLATVRTTVLGGPIAVRTARAKA
jgi:hypothetical protein